MQSIDTPYFARRRSIRRFVREYLYLLPLACGVVAAIISGICRARSLDGAGPAPEQPIIEHGAFGGWVAEAEGDVPLPSFWQTMSEAGLRQFDAAARDW